MSNNPTHEENPILENSGMYDDPLEELRRIRIEIAAEFGGNRELQLAALRVETWACGITEVSLGRNAHGPKEPDLPSDMSGLIPDREVFIERVRMWRSIRGKREADLDAYNEDARRRARVLGFPEESFVVSPNDFPPDVD